MNEYNNKRFYWIKLKTDFFNEVAIDFLLSQENGCEYIVLYQMLCLQTANSNGVLANQIGEVLIPYNAEKIQRDTKYFSIDTVRVALELYKKLGLIYEENNNILRITDYENMIGSITQSAIYKKKKKEKKLLETNWKNSNEIPIEIEKDIDIDIDYIINYYSNYINNNISAIEIEKIKKWCEKYKNNLDVIIYAIEYCRLYKAFNINYLCKILSNWEKSGYKTLEQVKASENIKNEDSKIENQEEIQEILEYDWLNENKC